MYIPVLVLLILSLLILILIRYQLSWLGKNVNSGNYIEQGSLRFLAFVHVICMDLYRTAVFFRLLLWQWAPSHLCLLHPLFWALLRGQGQGVFSVQLWKPCWRGIVVFSCLDSPPPPSMCRSIRPRVPRCLRKPP